MNTSFSQNKSFDKPKIVAHRGGALLAPENTLAAIKNALSIGVDRIEIDVQLSKDNVVVVIHDETLNRTTNKKGAVKNLTYSEILTADAGSKFSEKFINEKIPTLDEVLSVVEGKCVLLIEIKNENNIYPALEDEIVRLLHKHKALDWCVIQSFNYESLCKIFQLDKNIKTGMLFVKLPYEKIENKELDLHFVSEINISKNFANRKSIDFIHHLEKEVYVWTANTEAEMKKLISLGVDGIITDDPQKLKMLIN